jgi:hypothetical protein
MSNLINLRLTGWIVLGLIGVVVLFVLFAPGTTYIHWVGAKDLDITFRILDADSDKPVKGAKVNVLYQETNLCLEDPKPPFTHQAGDEGVVSHLSKECMCFGTSGGSGRTKKDTFAIHIPGWLMTVEAPGYQTTEPFELDTLEIQRRVVRDNKTATLEVVVRLLREARSGNATIGGPAGK